MGSWAHADKYAMDSAWAALPSFFMWDLVYDPIVFGMRAAVGAEAGTAVKGPTAVVEEWEQSAW